MLRALSPQPDPQQAGLVSCCHSAPAICCAAPSRKAVLLEAERNIRVKLNPQALIAYHELLHVVPLNLAPVPHIPAETAWLQMINAKDVHVVAASLAVAAAYVLTLDQRLAAQINRAGLPVQALAPGDFIRAVLTHHVNYPTLRT